jgi:chromosome segregation ATPase
MDIQWLVGTIIATVVALGSFIARDRALMQMITAGDKSGNEAVKSGDDALHERINRLRDDLSENYVQRRDLDQHMARIDNNLRDLRDELKDNTKTMQALLTHVKQSPS